MAKFQANEILELGMIAIPNSLFIDHRLSYRAVGTYCTIVQRLSMLGRFTTKDLVTEYNSIEHAKLAISELHSFGWITTTGADTYTVNISSTKPEATSKYQKDLDELNDNRLNPTMPQIAEGDRVYDLIQKLRNLSIMKVESTQIKEMLELFNYDAVNHCIGLAHLKHTTKVLASQSSETIINTIAAELEIFGDKALKGNSFAFREHLKVEQKANTIEDPMSPKSFGYKAPVKQLKYKNFKEREYTQTDYDDMIGWDD